MKCTLGDHQKEDGLLRDMRVTNTQPSLSLSTSSKSPSRGTTNGQITQ